MSIYPFTTAAQFDFWFRYALAGVTPLKIATCEAKIPSQKSGKRALTAP